MGKNVFVSTSFQAILSPKISNRQFAMTEVQTARDPLADVHNAFDNALLVKVREEFNELLKHPSLEPALGELERQYNIPREQIGAGVGVLIGLYLIFGSAAQLLCNLIGFGYPAYVSVKAIRTKETTDDTHMLIYWTVFATFSLIDFAAEVIMSYFPFYYLLKAAFLLYLYLPQTNGATRLYYSYVEPAMLKIEQIVQNYMNKKGA